MRTRCGSPAPKPTTSPARTVAVAGRNHALLALWPQRRLSDVGSMLGVRSARLGSNVGSVVAGPIWLGPVS